MHHITEPICNNWPFLVFPLVFVILLLGILIVFMIKSGKRCDEVAEQIKQVLTQLPPPSGSPEDTSSTGTPGYRKKCNDAQNQKDDASLPYL